MSDTPKTLLERLRDPVLMKRWWDQYGLEAAKEIERLTRLAENIRCQAADAYRDALDRSHKAFAAHTSEVRVFLRDLGPYLGLDEGSFKPTDFIQAAARIRQWCEDKSTECGKLRELLCEAGIRLVSSSGRAEPDGVLIERIEALFTGSSDETVSRNEGPFLVADGGAQGEHRYRTLIQGVPRWTLDPQEALWFARRRDAELYVAEDEDAWCILPVPAQMRSVKP